MERRPEPFGRKPLLYRQEALRGHSTILETGRGNGAVKERTVFETLGI